MDQTIKKTHRIQVTLPTEYMLRLDELFGSGYNNSETVKMMLDKIAPIKTKSTIKTIFDK